MINVLIRFVNKISVINYHMSAMAAGIIIIIMICRQ